MSDLKEGWFHCGRCGTLYKGALGEETAGPCPACAAESGGAHPAQDPSAAAPPMMVKRRRRRSVDSRHQPTGKKKRRRGSRRGAKVVAILGGTWVALLIAMAIASHWLWPSTEIPDENGQKPRWTALDEDERLLQAQLQGCGDKLMGFLKETSPEGRAQFVLRGTTTVPKMLRYQQGHPLFTYEGELKLISRAVLHTPAGPAIETLWQAGPDQRIEAVFFEENGEWKLDWEQFVRYGDEPWSLFVAGSGADQGVFRVLARRRSHSDSGGEGPFGLILAGPTIGQPAVSQASTPEIRIPDHPEMVAPLLEAFDQRDQGIGAFGSKLVAQDAQGMIRVRVRISRHREADGERTFKIEELQAIHWLDLPATPKAEPERKPQ